jgi:DNA-binding CsgD family transcriptional regulator
VRAVSDVVPDRHLVLYAPAAPRTGPGLTPREREIVSYLAHGLTGEEIARRLFLSPETVRTHIRNAMERMGARTRPHLIALALRHRLLADIEV